MGKVHYSGIKPKLTAPKAGVALSEIAVGSTVFLNINGTPTEFLVVNQGSPDDSLYVNTDGTWLLMKDIYETGRTAYNNYSYYNTSPVHSYLNGEFLALFDTDVQSAIKQVKIPYVNTYDGTNNITAQYGENGISAKIFLLAAREVNGIQTTAGSAHDLSYAAQKEGAALDYFSGTGNTNAQRIAYYNGVATEWFLRSTFITWGAGNFFTVTTAGQTYPYNGSYTKTFGIRPALVLPSTAYFDEETLLFKGVA